MDKLDQIDLAILKTLQQDGRISNADLAGKVGLSPSSCSRRLDILEKSGVISGYYAQVSHKALDYKMIAIVHISLSGQFAKTLAEFEAAVKRVPNILVC
ncbi:MAG: aldR, partial [Rhizobium sp.]|nr:aldR [Rhizobium sp.]